MARALCAPARVSLYPAAGASPSARFSAVCHASMKLGRSSLRVRSNLRPEPSGSAYSHTENGGPFRADAPRAGSVGDFRLRLLVGSGSTGSHGGLGVGES